MARTTSCDDRDRAAGGHFAAMEEPAALVRDIAAFFRELR